jgi:hypothetical protein
MSVVLVVLGMAFLALPGALTGRGAGLAPADWCRHVALCLRAGRLALLAGLAMLAAPAALYSLGAHHVAHACHESFHAGMPVPWVAGWLAALVLARSTWRSWRARRRDAAAIERLRVPGWLGIHHRSAGVDVVRVPADEVIAYAVPGHPGQVVLSQRLAGALRADELDAVVGHERAHLRHGHHDLLRLAADLDARFGKLGLVRRSTAALRLAVERWADEDAATGPAGRAAVRRALAGTVAMVLEPAAGFTAPCTLAARLQALDAPPPRPSRAGRVLVSVPALVLGGAASAVVLAGSANPHHATLGLLALCPFD